MNFKYFLPESKKPSITPEKFLPSLSFIIFARNPVEPNSRLQAIYSRRLPQVMKIKMDQIYKFNTNYVVPLDRSRGKPQYLSALPDSFWISPEFIEKFDRSDYLIGGEISLDPGRLFVQLYSRIEGKILCGKTYLGKKENFLEFINDFFFDMLSFLEIVLTPDERKRLEKQPSTKIEAIELLMSALDNDPLSPVGEKSKDDFLKFLLTAFQKDPDSETLTTLLVNQASQLENIGETRKAEEIIRKVLEAHPFDHDSSKLMAKIILRHQGTDKALEFIENALTKDRALADIPFNMALTQMQTDRNEDTIKLFDKALEYNKENPDIYDSYGYFLASVNRIRPALKIFKKGLELSPHREYTLLNTAQAYTELEELDKAKELYDIVQLLFSDSRHLKISKAIYYAQLGDLIKTRESILDALNSSPEDPLVNLSAARLYYRMKDKGNAERFARTTIDLDPSSFISEEARYFYSRITAGITEEEQIMNRDLFLGAISKMKKRDMRSAIIVLDRVLNIEPHYWRAWFLKGVGHRTLAQYEEALMAFEKVDELFEDQVSLHHEIGKCLMGLEDFQGAFGHIRYAFRNRTQEPEIMGNMAIVYMYLGRLQEAEVIFTQLKKTAPGFKNIDIYINELERLKKRKKSSRGNGDTKI